MVSLAFIRLQDVEIEDQKQACLACGLLLRNRSRSTEFVAKCNYALRNHIFIEIEIVSEKLSMYFHSYRYLWDCPEDANLRLQVCLPDFIGYWQDILSFLYQVTQ
jgi:hypothetical protein